MEVVRIIKKLYDGVENGFYKTGIDLEHESKIVSFVYSDLVYLSNLKNEMNESDFEIVLSTIQGVLKKPFNTYVSKNDMTLSYFQTNYALYLISYTESQPGRYIVFLEGLIYKFQRI